MKVQKRNVNNLLVLLLSLLLMVSGILSESLFVQLVSVNLIWFSNILYSLLNIKKRILFLLFNITFNVFLIGRMNVTTFLSYRRDERGLLGLNFDNPEIITQILIMLFISLLFLNIGYRLFENINLKLPVKKNKINISALRKSSLFLFMLSVVIRLYIVLELRNAATSEGYFDVYLTFQTSLPQWLANFGNLYNIFFIIFLATLPSKKKVLLPTSLYLFEGVIVALSGSRSGFLQNFLLVLVYFVMRYIENKEWIKLKEVISIILSVPMILIGMSFIGQIRGDFSGDVEITGAWDLIKDFFYTQGISVNVLGFSLIFRNLLPRKGFYTMGPFFEFIQNIYRNLNGLSALSGQSLERVNEGYLLSHTITYFNNPNAYLLGQGYGTSFIAENYVDFGIIGVAIGSLLYGLILTALTKGMFSKNFLVLTFSLAMIRGLFMVPRLTYFNIIVEAFTPPNFIALILVFIVAITISSLSKSLRA